MATSAASRVRQPTGAGRTSMAALAGSVMTIVGAGESARRLLVALTHSSARGESWQVFLANYLAALIIGAPLAFAVWGTANRLARKAPAIEMNALSRVAFALQRSLFRHARVLAGRLSAGPSADARAGTVSQSLLANGQQHLPVGLVTWLICAPATVSMLRWRRNTTDSGGPPPGTLHRRWHGAGGVLAWAVRVRPADPAGGAAGAASRSRVARPGGPDSPMPRHWYRCRTGLVGALVVATGGARTVGPAGHAERASSIRLVYLYGNVGRSSGRTGGGGSLCCIV